MNPTADFDDTRRYTLAEMQQAGWFWQVVPGSHDRKIALVGNCLRCGHPLGVVEERTYVGGSIAAEAAVAAPAPSSVWMTLQLPDKEQCHCKQTTHTGSAEGCGAWYDGTNQLGIQ